MFRSFLTIAYRSMRKNRMYTLIAIGGLVAGITSVFLISLFVQHEISYDRFHERAEDIYRIAWIDETPQTRTPHPMAQALVQDFPEVEEAVSLTPLWGAGLTRRTFTISNPLHDVAFEEKGLLAVDSTFFKVFTFSFLQGNVKDALSTTDGVVITAKTARKYFGEENPLGKSILVHQDSSLLKVTGVIADVPANAHFHFDFLISYVREKSSADEGDAFYTWKDFGHYNYVMLRPGSDYKKLESKLLTWSIKHVNISQEEVTNYTERGHGFQLQPLNDIHLHSKLRWELEPNGSIEYVYIMVGAAILLLIIACVNVMNLATAVASLRAKEIGIRKSLGSKRQLIIVQFLWEAVLTTSIALALSILFVDLLLPFYEALTGITFPVGALFSIQNLVVMVIIFIIIILLTGGYPAFYLSSIQPNLILKGRFSGSPKGAVIHKALIVFQYTAAMVLIASSLVIFYQLQFIKNKNLGYDKEQVLVIPIKHRAIVHSMEALQNELTRMPGVSMVSAASNIPGISFNQHPVYSLKDPMHRVNVAEVLVDFDFVELLDIPVLQGRAFSRNIPSDTGMVFVVNEAFVKELMMEEPVGSEFRWDLHEFEVQGKIIGVVKDFHFQSLHQAVQPILFKIYPAFNYVLVKLNSGTQANVIKDIEHVWKKFDQRSDFDFSFLDEKLNHQYQFEERMSSIVNGFAILAIVIASFGLFALAALNFNQRLKEIGIRKVLGAPVTSIMILLGKDFTKLVLVSVIIGTPLAWYGLHSWLQNFTYHIELEIWMFAVAGLGILGIAWATLAYLTRKMARINPVETLRAD